VHYPGQWIGPVFSPRDPQGNNAAIPPEHCGVEEKGRGRTVLMIALKPSGLAAYLHWPAWPWDEQDHGHQQCSYWTGADYSVQWTLTELLAYIGNSYPYLGIGHWTAPGALEWI